MNPVPVPLLAEAGLSPRAYTAPGLFREWAALAVFIVLLLLIAAALRRFRRFPLGLLGPVSAAVLVAWQTLLLNLLSLLDGVTVAGVLTGNGLAAAGLGLWLRNPLAAVVALSMGMGRRIRRWRAEWLAVPLAGLLLVVACAYPPTTYDAMTYHMSRVAHWMQHQSIAFYPTSIDRQNLMAPGAEYLILLLQLVAGTDYWANGVQWFAWLLAVLAVSDLGRMAGIPRRLCPWLTVFVAGLPMGIMQATSTQTDLVAALMTLAVAAACLPFWRALRRWTARDAVLLAVAVGAAVMVKPTALLAAAPFFGGPLVRIPGGWQDLRRRSGFLGRCVVLSLLVMAGIAGPHLVRSVHLLRAPEEASSPNRPRLWSYGLCGEWSERAFNPLFGTFAHHSVGKQAAADWIRRLPFDWAGKEAVLVSRHQHWVMQEDFAGNPFHLWIAAGLGLWLACAWRRLPPKVRAFALAPFASWIVFHLFIRNQVWLARLQLPVFMLLPLAWAAFLAGAPRARWRAAILIGASLACLGLGYYEATHMAGKPVLSGRMGNLTRDQLYYLYSGTRGQDLKAEHDRILAHMAATGGTRLGLVLGTDDYDYPLTWRAMRQGIEVRHCAPKSPWPDAFYVAARPR